MTARRPRLSAFPAWLMLGAMLGCGGSRDVAVKSEDVRGGSTSSDLPATTENGYEYIARRPLTTVGLAEGRGLPKGVGEAATDRVADAMQACLLDRLREGHLVAGAARVAARVEENGVPSGLNITVTPGSDVAANAILCFIAPIKSLSFPAREDRAAGSTAASASRGFAMETSWGPR